MTTEKKKNFLINTLYFLSVLALIFLSYRFLTVYFFPFLIGLILAYILQKPSQIIANRLRLKKGTVAAVLTGVCFCALVLICVLLIGFIFSRRDSILALLQNMLDFVSAAMGKISGVLGAGRENMPNELAALLENMPAKILESISEYLTSFVSGAAARLIKSTPALLISTVVTVVASVYIAKDYNLVKNYIISLIPEQKRKLVFATKRIVNTNILKILRGYLILMLITFVILVMGFSIMNIKNVWLISLLIAFIDLLPVLGTGTVLIPWAIFLALGGNYGQALGIAALYFVILAVRNFCEPKIVGKQIGIPPLVMLILFFLGLKFFGFIGMIFSVISLVVVVNLYKENLISL